ncbi:MULTISPECIES: P-type conjugative transfer protein TrbJ [Erythrobacteraceae]|uniref:P-type conjugative transfer protein TrbJ n=1 Tax=Pelagerythrobacter marinus TaxID=538382 RepID=A0ABW9UY68_9SPHN|nr:MULTISPECIES: P-type conjugative transfer protein TrbJ [Erythrobacteraceae]MXO69769.1 P-type conjugative transfer protein TrbJ [Pelagerythrobacter marinus]
MAMGIALALASTSALVSTPAHAQFGGIVYDPSNYAQNVLTAARTLEQINNQIRMLQNQATSLINQAKNLERLPTSILQPLQDQIRQTQQLLSQAQRIAYDVREIETAFAAQYRNVPLGASQQAMVEGAEARWQNSIAGFEDALKVQAGAVANIEGSRAAIGSLVGASQSATGALQAAQAGNQLLALQARQLADLTATLAASSRAQALHAADRAAAKRQAHEQLRRFLADRPRYVPGGSD